MDNMTRSAPAALLVTACNLAELAAAGDLDGLRHRILAVPPADREFIPVVLRDLAKMAGKLTEEDIDLYLGEVMPEEDHLRLGLASLFLKETIRAPGCCDECWGTFISLVARAVAAMAGAVFGTEDLAWRFRHLAAAVSVPRFADELLPPEPGLPAREPAPAVPAPRYAPPQM